MMKLTYSPANNWLLAIVYVCYLINRTVSQLLHWSVPLERLSGIIPDISPLIQFQWYDPVYYKQTNTDFPSDTRDKKGCFIGIDDNIGHGTTYKIITDHTHKIIC